MDTKTFAGIVKRLGGYDMRIFGRRLLLQKHIYFLQSFGVYLGYRFTWYLHGPYCPPLAKEGFDMGEGGETKDRAETVFVGSAEEKFNVFLQFLGERKDDAVWMETLASIHFLRKAYPDKSKGEIFEIVMRKQPYLDGPKLCEEAWAHLERFGLI